MRNWEVACILVSQTHFSVCFCKNPSLFLLDSLPLRHLRNISNTHIKAPVQTFNSDTQLLTKMGKGDASRWLQCWILYYEHWI